MPVSDMPIPLVIIVIIAIFSLFVILGIFVPRASAAPGKIANLPFFGSNSQAESGIFDLGYKALHVKIRPETGTISVDPLQIYEFHLTDQGALGNEHFSDKSMDDRGGISQYFDIKKWKDNKCVLFTTGFDNKPSVIIYKTTDPLDKNYIYYIDSGTIISSNIMKNPNLKSAIDSRYERGCKTIKCGDFNTGDYTICATECTIWPWFQCKDNYFFECDEEASDKVIEQDFGTGEDHCSEDMTGCPSTGCCSLLKTYPDNYKLVGGLMCGYSETEIASAKWWVCAPQNRGMLAYTKMKGEPNSAQYRCEAKASGSETSYEWVPAADQGINLENIQIKYDSTATDTYSVIQFYLANHNKEQIKDVSVKASISDMTGVDCSTYDCTELSVDKNKDGEWAEVAGGKIFSSQDLKCGYIAEEFCWKAKTFDVEINYKYSGSGKTDKFSVVCNPSTMKTSGEWHKDVCTASKK